MEKLNGKKINTAIFISGRGSNLKSLINFFKKKNSPILIKLVVSNNPKAKGLIFAQKSKINKYIINFKNKEKYSGSTVHLVNAKLDSGKIVLQKEIKISKKENEKSLERKVLKIEHKLYPNAIEKFLNSNL